MTDKEQKHVKLREMLDILGRDGDIETTYCEGKIVIKIIDVKNCKILKQFNNQYKIRYYKNPITIVEMLNLLLQFDFTMMSGGSLQGYFDNNLRCICYFESQHLLTDYLLIG